VSRATYRVGRRGGRPRRRRAGPGLVVARLGLPLSTTRSPSPSSWRWSRTGWSRAIGCLRFAALTPPGEAR